jgi:predicted  nucleic acid-binding Zn-ribbon protein
MAEVFISYARDDRKLVEPIAAQLKELGVDTWFDIRIESGEDFEAVIKAELSKAKAVLVCWTEKASSSHWVRSEAKLALKLGTYVPVFVSECELPLALSEIHTDTLVRWHGAANDESWLKVVERLSKNIGREAIAGAARAFAAGDDPTLYDFARGYPDEPTARKIWADAETRHRDEFSKQMAKAKALVAAQMNAERINLDGRLMEAHSALQDWLAGERRGSAPDPLAFVSKTDSDAEGPLKHEIASLSSALAKSKSRDDELEAANSKITQLSDQLAAEDIEAQHLKDEIAALSSAVAEAKAREEELQAAKSDIADLSDRLTTARTPLQRSAKVMVRVPGLRAWGWTALVGVIALGTGAMAARSLVLHDMLARVAALDKELSDTRSELKETRSQVESGAAEVQNLNAAIPVADQKLYEGSNLLQEADQRYSNLKDQRDALLVRKSVGNCPGNVKFVDLNDNLLSDQNYLQLQFRTYSKNTARIIVSDLNETNTINVCTSILFSVGNGNEVYQGDGGIIIGDNTGYYLFAITTTRSGGENAILYRAGSDLDDWTSIDLKGLTRGNHYNIRVEIKSKIVEYYVDDQKMLDHSYSYEVSKLRFGLFAGSQGGVKIDFGGFVVSK